MTELKDDKIVLDDPMALMIDDPAVTDEWRKIDKVEDVLKEGQEIEVKIIDIDPKTGKIKLSRKELLPRPPRQEPEKKNPEQNQNK
jgi:ribosomal protein S1